MQCVWITFLANQSYILPVIMLLCRPPTLLLKESIALGTSTRQSGKMEGMPRKQEEALTPVRRIEDEK